MRTKIFAGLCQFDEKGPMHVCVLFTNSNSPVLNPYVTDIVKNPRVKKIGREWKKEMSSDLPKKVTFKKNGKRCRLHRFGYYSESVFAEAMDRATR